MKVLQILSSRYQEINNNNNDNYNVNNSNDNNNEY